MAGLADFYGGIINPQGGIYTGPASNDPSLFQNGALSQSQVDALYSGIIGKASGVGAPPATRMVQSVPFGALPPSPPQPPEPPHAPTSQNSAADTLTRMFGPQSQPFVPAYGASAFTPEPRLAPSYGLDFVEPIQPHISSASNTIGLPVPRPYHEATGYQVPLPVPRPAHTSLADTYAAPPPPPPPPVELTIRGGNSSGGSNNGGGSSAPTSFAGTSNSGKTYNVGQSYSMNGDAYTANANGSFTNQRTGNILVGSSRR